MTKKKKKWWFIALSAALPTLMLSTLAMSAAANSKSAILEAQANKWKNNLSQLMTLVEDYDVAKTSGDTELANQLKSEIENFATISFNSDINYGELENYLTALGNNPNGLAVQIPNLELANPTTLYTYQVKVSQINVAAWRQLPTVLQSLALPLNSTYSNTNNVEILIPLTLLGGLFNIQNIQNAKLVNLKLNGMNEQCYMTTLSALIQQQVQNNYIYTTGLNAQYQNSMNLYDSVQVGNIVNEFNLTTDGSGYGWTSKNKTATLMQSQTYNYDLGQIGLTSSGAGVLGALASWSNLAGLGSAIFGNSFLANEFGTNNNITSQNAVSQNWNVSFVTPKVSQAVSGEQTAFSKYKQANYGASWNDTSLSSNWHQNSWVTKHNSGIPARTTYSCKSKENPAYKWFNSVVEEYNSNNGSQSLLNNPAQVGVYNGYNQNITTTAPKWYAQYISKVLANGASVNDLKNFFNISTSSSQNYVNETWNAIQNKTKYASWGLAALAGTLLGLGFIPGANWLWGVAVVVGSAGIATDITSMVYNAFLTSNKDAAANISNIYTSYYNHAYLGNTNGDIPQVFNNSQGVFSNLTLNNSAQETSLLNKLYTNWIGLNLITGSLNVPMQIITGSVDTFVLNIQTTDGIKNVTIGSTYSIGNTVNNGFTAWQSTNLVSNDSADAELPPINVTNVYDYSLSQLVSANSSTVKSKIIDSIIPSDTAFLNANQYNSDVESDISAIAGNLANESVSYSEWTNVSHPLIWEANAKSIYGGYMTGGVSGTTQAFSIGVVGLQNKLGSTTLNELKTRDASYMKTIDSAVLTALKTKLTASQIKNLSSASPSNFYKNLTNSTNGYLKSTITYWDTKTHHSVTKQNSVLNEPISLANVLNNQAFTSVYKILLQENNTTKITKSTKLVTSLLQVKLANLVNAYKDVYNYYLGTGNYQVESVSKKITTIVNPFNVSSSGYTAKTLTAHFNDVNNSIVKKYLTIDGAKATINSNWGYMTIQSYQTLLNNLINAKVSNLLTASIVNNQFNAQLSNTYSTIFGYRSKTTNTYGANKGSLGRGTKAFSTNAKTASAKLTLSNLKKWLKTELKGVNNASQLISLTNKLITDSMKNSGDTLSNVLDVTTNNSYKYTATATITSTFLKNSIAKFTTWTGTAMQDELQKKYIPFITFIGQQKTIKTVNNKAPTQQFNLFNSAQANGMTVFQATGGSNVANETVLFPTQSANYKNNAAYQIEKLNYTSLTTFSGANLFNYALYQQVQKATNYSALTAKQILNTFNGTSVTNLSFLNGATKLNVQSQLTNLYETATGQATDAVLKTNTSSGQITIPVYFALGSNAPLILDQATKTATYSPTVPTILKNSSLTITVPQDGVLVPNYYQYWGTSGTALGNAGYSYKNSATAQGLYLNPGTVVFKTAITNSNYVKNSQIGSNTTQFNGNNFAYSTVNSIYLANYGANTQQNITTIKNVLNAAKSTNLAINGKSINLQFENITSNLNFWQKGDTQNVVSYGAPAKSKSAAIFTGIKLSQFAYKNYTGYNNNNISGASLNNSQKRTTDNTFNFNSNPIASKTVVSSWYNANTITLTNVLGNSNNLFSLLNNFNLAFSENVDSKNNTVFDNIGLNVDYSVINNLYSQQLTAVYDQLTDNGTGNNLRVANNAYYANTVNPVKKTLTSGTSNTAAALVYGTTIVSGNTVGSSAPLVATTPSLTPKALASYFSGVSSWTDFFNLVFKNNTYTLSANTTVVNKNSLDIAEKAYQSYLSGAITENPFYQKATFAKNFAKNAIEYAYASLLYYTRAFVTNTVNNSSSQADKNAATTVKTYGSLIGSKTGQVSASDFAGDLLNANFNNNNYANLNSYQSALEKIVNDETDNEIYTKNNAPFDLSTFQASDTTNTPITLLSGASLFDSFFNKSVSASTESSIQTLLKTALNFKFALTTGLYNAVDTYSPPVNKDPNKNNVYTYGAVNIPEVTSSLNNGAASSTISEYTTLNSNPYLANSWALPLLQNDGGALLAYNIDSKTNIWGLYNGTNGNTFFGNTGSNLTLFDDLSLVATNTNLAADSSPYADIQATGNQTINIYGNTNTNNLITTANGGLPKQTNALSITNAINVWLANGYLPLMAANLSSADFTQLGVDLTTVEKATAIEFNKELSALYKSVNNKTYTFDLTENNLLGALDLWQAAMISSLKTNEITAAKLNSAITTFNTNYPLLTMYFASVVANNLPGTSAALILNNSANYTQSQFTITLLTDWFTKMYSALYFTKALNSSDSNVLETFTNNSTLTVNAVETATQNQINSALSDLGAKNLTFNNLATLNVSDSTIMWKNASATSGAFFALNNSDATALTAADILYSNNALQFASSTNNQQGAGVFYLNTNSTNSTFSTNWLGTYIDKNANFTSVDSESGLVNYLVNDENNNLTSYLNLTGNTDSAATAWVLLNQLNTAAGYYQAYDFPILAGNIRTLTQVYGYSTLTKDNQTTDIITPSQYQVSEDNAVSDNDALYNTYAITNATGIAKIANEDTYYTYAENNSKTNNVYGQALTTSLKGLKNLPQITNVAASMSNLLFSVLNNSSQLHNAANKLGYYTLETEISFLSLNWTLENSAIVNNLYNLINNNAFTITTNLYDAISDAVQNILNNALVSYANVQVDNTNSGTILNNGSGSVTGSAVSLNGGTIIWPLRNVTSKTDGTNQDLTGSLDYNNLYGIFNMNILNVDGLNSANFNKTAFTSAFVSFWAENQAFNAFYFTNSLSSLDGNFTGLDLNSTNSWFTPIVDSTNSNYANYVNVLNNLNEKNIIGYSDTTFEWINFVNVLASMNLNVGLTSFADNYAIPAGSTATNYSSSTIKDDSVSTNNNLTPTGWINNLNITDLTWNALSDVNFPFEAGAVGNMNTNLTLNSTYTTYANYSYNVATVLANFVSTANTPILFNVSNNAQSLISVNSYVVSTDLSSAPDYGDLIASATSVNSTVYQAVTTANGAYQLNTYKNNDATTGASIEIFYDTTLGVYFIYVKVNNNDLAANMFPTLAAGVFAYYRTFAENNGVSAYLGQAVTNYLNNAQTLNGQAYCLGAYNFNDFTSSNTAFKFSQLVNNAENYSGDTNNIINTLNNAIFNGVDNADYTISSYNNDFGYYQITATTNSMLQAQLNYLGAYLKANNNDAAAVNLANDWFNLAAKKTDENYFTYSTNFSASNENINQLPENNWGLAEKDGNYFIVLRLPTSATAAVSPVASANKTDNLAYLALLLLVIIAGLITWLFLAKRKKAKNALAANGDETDEFNSLDWNKPVNNADNAEKASEFASVAGAGASVSAETADEIVDKKSAKKAAKKAKKVEPQAEAKAPAKENKEENDETW